MNIYLCGFMGTGKTVVGKILARRLKLTFIDMDDEIEREEHMTIPEIFSRKGEPYFRKKEKEWVKKLTGMDDLVVSLGGGVIVNGENFDLLNKRGTLILLQAPADIIYERTKSFTHRPLLEVQDPKVRIKELLDKRKPYYDKVAIKIDTEDKTVEEVADNIVEILDENKGNPRIT